MNRMAAASLALLIAALLTAGCGGSDSSAGGGPVAESIKLEDHPDLEVYDNEHTTEGQRHLLPGESAEYTVIPPYGEEHSAYVQPCGVYSSSPTFEMVVHALEHGAIAFWYSPNELTADDIAALTEIAAKHHNDNDYVIQAPYGGLDHPLILVAWGARLPLDTVDEDLIEQFFDKFHDNAPEPLAAGGCPTAR